MNQVINFTIIRFTPNSAYFIRQAFSNKTWKYNTVFDLHRYNTSWCPIRGDQIYDTVGESQYEHGAYSKLKREGWELD